MPVFKSPSHIRRYLDAARHEEKAIAKGCPRRPATLLQLAAELELAANSLNDEYGHLPVHREAVDLILAVSKCITTAEHAGDLPSTLRRATRTMYEAMGEDWTGRGPGKYGRVAEDLANFVQRILMKPPPSGETANDIAMYLAWASMYERGAALVLPLTGPVAARERTLHSTIETVLGQTSPKDIRDGQMLAERIVTKCAVAAGNKKARDLFGRKSKRIKRAGRDDA